MNERKTNRAEIVLSGVLLLVSFLFLLGTARPDLEASDSAELVAAACSLGIPHATGYPLYTSIGRIAVAASPFDPARTMNLLSALIAGSALVLFALAGREITGNLLSASVPIAGLVFARPLWFVATIAEVYALHLLLLAATLFFLLRWRRTGARSDLLLAIYAAALGFAHHGSTALFLPGYVLFVLLHLRSARRGARRAAGLLLVPVALSIYLYHPIRHAAGPPIDSFRDLETKTEMGLLDPETVGETFAGRFFYKVLGGGPGRKLDLSGETARARASSLLPLFRSSLGTLFLLAGIAGLVWGAARGPRTVAALLAWGFLANTAYFLSFRTEDLEDFLVPSFFFLALGAAILLEIARRAASSLGARGAGGTVLLLALAAGNGAEVVSAAGKRGGYRHVAPILDRERDLLRLDFPPGSRIVIPWGRATVLRYLQVAEEIRPDIEVHPMTRRQYGRVVSFLLERGPVFAEDAGGEMRERFQVSSFGPLFRVEKRPGEAGVSD
ncbi:MAG: DUF2723 domain-containing protein [Candidatus Eisenbacteria bacterium]